MASRTLQQLLPPLDSPSLNAADCVFALAASDANDDLQIDRVEFNAVVLEILAGCRLADASTTQDFDYIFQTAACYCLDYDDDVDCCSGDEMVIYRAGQYPSDYLFRVCEFLESAVTFTCAAHETPRTAPPTVVPLRTAPTTTAPASDNNDISVLSLVLIPWIIVWTLLLCLVLLLLMAIVCLLWHQQRRDGRRRGSSSSSSDATRRRRRQRREAATTVAVGTYRDPPYNKTNPYGLSSDDDDEHQHYDRVLDDVLATDRIDDSIHDIPMFIQSPASQSFQSFQQQSLQQQGTGNQRMTSDSPHAVTEVTVPSNEQSEQKVAEDATEDDTSDGVYQGEDEKDDPKIARRQRRQRRRPRPVAHSPIPHVGDVLDDTVESDETTGQIVLSPRGAAAVGRSSSDESNRGTMVLPSPSGADIVTDDEDMVMTLGMSFSSSPSSNLDSFVTSRQVGTTTDAESKQDITSVNDNEEQQHDFRLGMGGVDDDDDDATNDNERGPTGRWK